MKFFIKTPALFLIAFLSFSSCKKQISVTPPAIVPPVAKNQPPVARSGVDQTIMLPVNSVILSGSASSDTDGSVVSYLWKQIAGPNQSSISTASKVSTVANQLIVGVYQYELKVTDNKGLSSKDTVVVTVVPDPRLINMTLVPVGALSLERNNVASASIGDKIFYAGGNSGLITVFSRVDIYDVSTHQWSTAELSEARTLIGAVAVGNKILFAGGAKNFDVGDDWGWTDLSSRVDIYDVSTNSWSTTELPGAMEFRLGREGMAVGAGNKAFFCGGEDLVYIYDAVTDSWSTQKLSEYRNYFAATSVGNKLFIGGSSSIVDVYDMSTGIWSVASLSIGREMIRAATFDNKVFFAGGASPLTDVVDIYDNATGNWSTSKLSTPTLLTGIAPLGQKLLFFGDNHVDIYDSSLNTWSIANLNQFLPDGSVFNSVGGEVYITKGKEVWKIQL